MNFFQKYLKYKNKYLELKKLVQKGGSDVTITIKYIGELVKHKEPLRIVISKDSTGLMIKQKIFAEDSRLNIDSQVLIRNSIMIANDAIPNLIEGDEVTVVIRQNPSRLSVAKINRRAEMMVPPSLPPSAYGPNVYGKW